jgi:hypothetical protein
MKPAATVATIFLALVAIAHLVRYLLHVDITAGGKAVPMWPSLVAFLFTGGLALMLWREGRR